MSDTNRQKQRAPKRLDRKTHLIGWVVLLVTTLAGCTFDYTIGGDVAGAEQEATMASSFDDAQVEISEGVLQGALADAATQTKVFRGIPYAAPPVGELRFRAPAPATPWTGVRSALDFGTACWQDFSGESFVWSRGEFQRSEDCLYLNVWTGAQSAKERRPVMVWFHGGSHTGGYGHSKIFDGTTLAQRGVILVSINYRLGPFGFLAHEVLAKESEHASAGNYGLLDKLAALRWVQTNIAAFGGDPDNVTVFGQSAGSSSVCYLMSSPLAKGLFHKAIGQSAACMNELPGDADLDGRERGARLVAEAGLAAPTAHELRRLSPEELLAAAQASGWNGPSRVVIDGWVVPEPPLQRFARGDHNAVPLLAGSMADEGNQLVPLNAQLSEDQLKRRLAARLGPHSDRIASLYAADIEQSPGLGQREIFTDQFMAWSMRSWVRANARAGQPSYLYFFKHVPPAFRLYLPHNPDLNLPDGPRSGGAYHSGDLAYVFGSQALVGSGWTDRDREISRQITTYWSNFAKTGNPNGSGVPDWPLYSLAAHETLVIGASTQSTNGVRQDKLDAFDDVLRWRQSK